MCATALTPEPAVISQDALDGVLAATHDAWMADGDRFLGPFTHPDATFLERWAAMSYLGNQFPERLQLEQALLIELQQFLTPEIKERLWMQVDRLMRLYRDLEQLTQRRSAARELARAAREVLEALRLWYAEIEFAAGDVRRSDVSREGIRLLAKLDSTRCGWADACA
jgi:hypothetical protein